MPKVFTRMAIIPDFHKGHFIQWTIDPFFNAPLPYNFKLQCAQTLSFKELIFEKEVGDTFFAIDDTNKKQSWSFNYAYRVTLTDAIGHVYASEPIWFGTNLGNQRKYAQAAEIIRKETLLCRYSGQYAWLLKHKTYGAAVPQKANIDRVSGMPITDTAEQDYGTGMQDGYFEPVGCMYLVETSAEDKQLDPAGMGVKETNDINVRMPGYPIVDARDILVTNLTGYRYSVMARETTAFPGTNIVIVQKASLRMIPPTDTVYSIAVPKDYDELA